MAIDSYYKAARERASRKKSPWNWILLPFSIIGIAGAFFFISASLLSLQKLLFSPDAILSSGTRVGNNLIIVPSFFLALPLGFIFANLFTWCIPPARKALDGEAAGVNGASFKESIKGLIVGFVIILLIVVPLSFLGVLNYFYITNNGVTAHFLFTLHEKHYDWSDIVKIHAECTREDGSFFWSYVLHMKDGKKVDIFEETRLKFVSVYYKIKPFIRAQKHIKYSYKLGVNEIRWLKSRYPQDAEKIIRIIQNKE